MTEERREETRPSSMEGRIYLISQQPFDVRAPRISQDCWDKCENHYLPIVRMLTTVTATKLVSIYIQHQVDSFSSPQFSLSDLCFVVAFSTMFSGSPSITAKKLGGDRSSDIQLAFPPNDAVSSLVWSPVANHLAVASWDNKVRVYDVPENSVGTGLAVMEFRGPVLSCDWSQVRQLPRFNPLL